MAGSKVMGRPEGARGRDGFPSLHVVLDLEQILEALIFDQEELRRFGNVLEGFPGLVFTAHTDRPAREALGLLAGAGLRPPHHLLADSGTQVFHLEEGRGLVRDPEFGAWLAFQTGFRPAAGAAKAAGIEFLEISWETPRPLVVSGRVDTDLSLLGLADLPLLRPGGIDADSFLPAHPFLLQSPGLSETVRILLACLAPQGPEPMPADRQVIPWNGDRGRRREVGHG